MNEKQTRKVRKNLSAYVLDPFLSFIPGEYKKFTVHKNFLRKKARDKGLRHFFSGDGEMSEDGKRMKGIT